MKNGGKYVLGVIWVIKGLSSFGRTCGGGGVKVERSFIFVRSAKYEVNTSK